MVGLHTVTRYLISDSLPSFTISLSANERHEAASFQHIDGTLTILLANKLKLLRESQTNRNNHPSPLVQLVKQRCRNSRGRGRNDNSFERRPFRQTLTAVTDSHKDVSVSEALQNLLGRT